MAIKQYHDHDVTPPIDSTLSELSQHSFSTRAFLSMLGDYWTDYYKGTVDLAQAHTGSITAAGRQLTRLYELLLSGNIIDFPVEQGPAFDLLVFDKDDFSAVYDENGELESYFVSADGCDIDTFQYLTTSLFESAVILVNGEHFKCADGGIYFYVDIFEDPAIRTYEYTLGDDSVHKVLLWSSPIVVNHYYMYERYGRFIYRKAVDSYKYKWLLTGLMRYYTGPKSCANIQKVLDILFGIPYCRADEETIVDLTYTDEDLNDWTNPRTDEASYIRITTDKRVYYTYAMAEMDFGVGDTVKRNQMFGHFCRVLDYINCPYWWANEAWYFPDSAFDSDDESGLTREEKNDIMDRLLKYNTVYFNINLAYESWDLYKQIVGELYNIIKRGFPVYLNPYIEVIFRTAFSDDTDFWEKAKDCLYPMFGEFTYYDEFCRIRRYNGIEHHHWPWLYDLWDHHWGRMTDRLDMSIVLPEFEDVVSFCPSYDGMFDHDAEILYSCMDVFAYDRMKLTEVTLGGSGGGDGSGIWTDDGWTENAAGIFLYKDSMAITSLGTDMVDMFDPPLRYDSRKTYGGKVRPQPWNGTYGHRVRDVMGLPGQAAFDMNIAMHDWVVYEGNVYDGDHEHEGDILYDGTMFCGELFEFVANMPIDMGDDPYPPIDDNLDVGYVLHPYYDEYDTEDDPEDSLVVEHRPAFSDSVPDYRCPPKHNKVINHRGNVNHSGKCTVLGYDDFDITFCHVEDSDTVSPVMNNFVITKISTV